MYKYHLSSHYGVLNLFIIKILGHIQPNFGASGAPVVDGLIHRGGFGWEHGRLYGRIEPSSRHNRHRAEIRHLHARVRLLGLRGDIYLYELDSRDAIRGHPYMTSALRGGGGLAHKKM